MKIKVYVPAFIAHQSISPENTVVLEDGATIHTLYDALKLPPPLRFSFFCSINYEQAKWETPLQDGDIVSLLLPISGG